MAGDSTTLTIEVKDLDVSGVPSPAGGNWWNVDPSKPYTPSQDKGLMPSGPPPPDDPIRPTTFKGRSPSSRLTDLQARFDRHANRSARAAFFDEELSDNDKTNTGRHGSEWQKRDRRLRSPRKRRSHGFGLSPGRAFGRQVMQGLQGAGQGIAQHGISGIASGIGAGVGAATGSATLGAGAGSIASAGLGALSALGPPGIALGAGLAATAVAFTAVSETARTVNRSLTGMAEGLSGVSGQVASAQAVAEINRLRTLMNRDQQIGGGLAQYTLIKSRMDSDIAEIKTVLASKILPVAIEVAQVVGYLIERAKDVVDVIPEAGDIAQATSTAVAVNFGPMGILLKLIADHLAEQAREASRKREAEQIDVMNEMWGLFNPLWAGNKQGPMPKNRQKEAGVGLFPTIPSFNDTIDRLNKPLGT